MSEPTFVPFRSVGFGPAESQTRACQFLELMSLRRSVRDFSPEPVPRVLIEKAIQTASTAPSGANRQPWKFVAVQDPAIKHEIRLAAENEEKRSYQERMPEEWLDAIRPLGTDWRKPFLEIAPWLVVVFAESYGQNGSKKKKNYYVQESVGIACGLFIAAIQNMGLVTLTHTPSPMNFLSRILKRPKNERPFILFPVGHPADSAEVPIIEKKSLDEVSCWFEDR